jgi:hypothetical protein
MMSKQKSVAILLLAVLMGTGSVLAQESFQDFVKEQGLGWVMGRWTAQTDEGQTIELGYRWALKGQMIVSTFKMGEVASQGIIYMIPDEEKVVEVGVYSDGDRIKASWEPKGDKLVSTREKIGDYGDSQKMAVVLAKGKGRGTMTAAIHAFEYGSMADEAMATLEFKRAPARKKAKATGTKN